MIKNIYVIYDTKAQVYNSPFFLLNDAVAQRNCESLMLEDNDVSRNPEDFSLFKIGTYDDETAAFDLESSPVHLLSFHTLNRSQSPFPSGMVRVEDVSESA